MNGFEYIQHIESVIGNLYSEALEDALESVKDLILASEKHFNRVHITGIGKPSYSAKYIASLLSSTGTKTYFLDATECIHGSAGQVSRGDVVIAISNSGKTEELIKAVETLKKLGVMIVGVSGDENSKLATASDIHLCVCVPQEGDSLNKPPRASFIACTLVLQILSLKLQESKSLTMGQYLMWHPGGAIGETKGDNTND